MGRFPRVEGDITWHRSKAEYVTIKRVVDFAFIRYYALYEAQASHSLTRANGFTLA